VKSGVGRHLLPVTDPIQRRKLLLALPGFAAAGCVRTPDSSSSSEHSSAAASDRTRSAEPSQSEPTLSQSEPTILSRFELGFQWPTFDPFLFCVHHHDDYPRGNAELGPVGSLSGRRMGSDFSGKDGWRMYHGLVVPGFPRHPHRGFETVTVTRRGFIDHSDSLGATARYGQGDVQWMTAGKGIVHAEMFPLLDEQAPNPAELFQIWLNLPKRDKFVDPYFTMFWKDSIPDVDVVDAAGKTTVVRVIAGQFSGKRAPAPPPDSYASKPESELVIWSIRMPRGARFVLPEIAAAVDRTLYFWSGPGLLVDGERIGTQTGLRLAHRRAIELSAEAGDAELLLLGGKPIGEPVAHRGPFVMNDERQLRKAYEDYRRTQFGGWPWPSNDPVHAREAGRFAIHADGRKERAI
jgi:hypothetical protein